MTLPILYSLRNCPFAMRARIALYKARQIIELREVNLKNKPTQMLRASAKATVPILVLPSGKVIDESFDVMVWALNENDPSDLLLSSSSKQQQMYELITQFDHEFKGKLEDYKCAKRYHETNLVECRAACEHYIASLEQNLTQHKFLMGEQESLADIALLPFIRQFAKVERQWYLTSPYPKLRLWLNAYLQSPLFTKVMTKYPQWHEGSELHEFGQK